MVLILLNFNILYKHCFYLITIQIAMKKFILRKIFMLIYFLDCAKEQQLIRHNPCLFKIDSSYKVNNFIMLQIVIYNIIKLNKYVFKFIE